MAMSRKPIVPSEFGKLVIKIAAEDVKAMPCITHERMLYLLPLWKRRCRFHAVATTFIALCCGVWCRRDSDESDEPQHVIDLFLRFIACQTPARNLYFFIWFGSSCCTKPRRGSRGSSYWGRKLANWIRAFVSKDGAFRSQ